MPFATLTDYLFAASFPVLAEMPDSFFVGLFVSTLLFYLLGPLIKSGVLVWAYIKTRKLAALCYAVYLIAYGVFSVTTTFFGYAEQRSEFFLIGWLVEIGLFGWLMASFVRRWQSPSARRSRKPIAPPADGSR